MKARTLIITKEGYKAFLEYDRKRKFLDSVFDYVFSKLSRNSGASNNDFPIADNEYRFIPSYWGYEIDTIKKFLDEQGLSYREDGFQFEFKCLRWL